MKRKRLLIGKETRICEGCGKEFQFQKCYSKRPWRAGRFCSVACRSLKPNISQLTQVIGPKARASYRQKIYYQELRLKALQSISNDIPTCGRCGCDSIPILEINHIHGGGSKRKESGPKLWRLVLSLGDEAKKYFNVRCKVCNQLEYVETQFTIHRHNIIWKRQNQKRLIIDVDEILCNFQTPVLEIIYRLYGKKLSPYDFKEWDIFNTFSKAEQTAIFKEINKPGFCSALVPISGAIEAISILRQYVDIYPVSSPFPSPTWGHERYEWLQNHFGFERKKVVFTSAKYLIAGDAFLDDNPENVTSWLEEHPDKLGMLWHIPNTRKMTEYDYLRVNSWEKVIALVKNLVVP